MPSEHRGLFLILYFNLLCLGTSFLEYVVFETWAGLEETIVRVSLFKRRGR